MPPPQLHHPSCQDTETEERDLTSLMIRGVALDMDGLLFETEGLYWQVGDTVLQRRGYRYSKELQSRMMGRVGVAAVQQMIDLHNLEDDAVELLAECDEIFASMLELGVDQMPGVDAMIRRFQNKKLPFGLATSSRRRFATVLMETVDWKSDLKFSLTGDDVTRGKPDPQMYQMAADRLGIPPQQMLVLEDSGNGCAAGVAAGAIVVAVPSEHTKEQCFDGSVLIADTLNDPKLIALIENQ
ncbi:MAG: HAD-IA family hydrolase [Rubripirellula sp.]|nr:HAD-IA family hydrolase [Rubripirellula sp.]